MVWLLARIMSNKVVGEIEIWVSAEHVVGVWSESWGRTEHSWAPHEQSLALSFRLSSDWGLDSALALLLGCVTPAAHPECFPLQDLLPPGDPAGKVKEFWPGQPKSCE